MAETAGVTTATPTRRGGSRGRTPPKGKGPRPVFIIAGLGAGLFLLSRGASGGGTSSTQAASDALAAQQAANANLTTDPASFDPAGVPVDTGGGSYTQQGPSATTSPAVVVNLTPGAAPTPVVAPGVLPPGTKPPGKPKSTLPKGWKPLPGGAKKPKAPKGYTSVGLGGGRWGAKPVAKPKPKQAPKGKPKPAGKEGKHEDTARRTPSGAKKNSPALVESVDGWGSGCVVMGRHFPGSISHRMGAPYIDMLSGLVCRTVTVDYGGRTDTHLVMGDGSQWQDRVPGKNPPSRGVPVVSAHPMPV